MMLRIGSKRRAYLSKKRTHKNQSSFFNLPSLGFTLVEVMVAVVILSVGLVIIYESFLISLDTINFFSNRLHAQLFMREKIWQVQNMLEQSTGIFLPTRENGSVDFGTRRFNWYVDLNLQDAQQQLYTLNASMVWSEGHKLRVIRRSTAVKRYLGNFDIAAN